MHVIMLDDILTSDLACDSIVVLYFLGVVYMKNTLVQYWDEMYRKKNSFVINERDKQLVRENIVQAILTASNLIR